VWLLADLVNSSNLLVAIQLFIQGAGKRFFGCFALSTVHLNEDNHDFWLFGQCHVNNWLLSTNIESVLHYQVKWFSFQMSPFFFLFSQEEGNLSGVKT